MVRFISNFCAALCSARYSVCVAIVLFTGFLFTSLPLTAQSIATNTPVLEAMSSKGQEITIYSSLTPLEINKIHSWILVLRDDSGEPIENAEIIINGGMPEHDHGLPTAPQVTRQLEAGRYLVEGVRFHMPGLWQIFIDLDVAGEQSTAVIDLEL